MLVANPIEFKNLWHEAVEALERALNLLRHPQEFGAISSQYLPYAAILPAFAALQVEAGQLPAEQARCSAKDASLVLGQRLHQPLFRSS